MKIKYIVTPILLIISFTYSAEFDTSVVSDLESLNTCQKCLILSLTSQVTSKKSQKVQYHHHQ
jgi:hypothetical protein